VGIEFDAASFEIVSKRLEEVARGLRSAFERDKPRYSFEGVSGHLILQ
jgi:hypothetical protein